MDSHLSYSPTYACLWAMFVYTLIQRFTSELSENHKHVSDLVSELPLSLPLPYSLAGCGGTGPDWWDLAQAAVGIHPQLPMPLHADII